jgi:hypothetical protein
VDLIFHGPIALYWPGGDLYVRGVYWLRIYRDTESAVVIFTDIPANQGPDAEFADTELAEMIMRDHLPANLKIRWFSCSPAVNPTHLSIKEPGTTRCCSKAPG